MDRQTTDRNVRYLVIEIFWAAIFTGCVAFNAAYIIRLGGSNLLVSLLTSGAALVNAVASLPFAAFLERMTNRRPWIIGSLVLVRLGHIGLILVPWLVGNWRGEAAVLLLIVLNVPVALFTVGFLPMLADVLPLHRRARVFAARNMTLGATAAATTFALGLWLDRVAFPLNYQLVYALGVVTSMISSVYFARIVIPNTPVVIKKTERPRLNIATLAEIGRTQRPFVNIVFNTLIFNIAFWMAVPLQPIYFVRTLGASDGWIGLWAALVSVGTIGGNLLWERLIRRHGFSWALLRGTALSAVYYFLIGTFPNLSLILVFALLAGLVNPGVELSHLNILLDVCPPERRATYLAIFSTVMNLGFFLAPLAVAPLTDLIGTQMLVLMLGVLRLLGAALFVLNPVRSSADTTMRAEQA